MPKKKLSLLTAVRSVLAAESVNIKEVYAVKVRIKFTKTGHMKFVGHLDTMRYFQKAIRRAELPVAFPADTARI